MADKAAEKVIPFPSAEPQLDQSPEVTKDNIIRLESIQNLERALWRQEPDAEKDREHLEESAKRLKTALELFKGVTDVEEIESRDPNKEFLEAFGEYTASAMAMFRSLHPRESSAQTITLFDFVYAKMTKMELKYGKAPQLMEKHGISKDKVYKMLRDMWTGMPEDATSKEIEGKSTVVELSDVVTRIERGMETSLDESIGRLEDECDELEEALEELPIEDQHIIVEQRDEEHAREGLKELSLGEMVALEKTDRLFAVSGEMADIFIGALGLASTYGPDASSAVVAAVAKRLKAELGEKAATQTASDEVIPLDQEEGA